MENYRIYRSSEIKEVCFELLDPDATYDVPEFNNSYLSAINTCPTLATTMFPSATAGTDIQSESHAINAGRLCHDVFAAVKLWTLMYVQNLPEHAYYHGERIFGIDRWNIMKETFTPDNHAHSALSAYDTSNFEDREDDKTRTKANILHSLEQFLTVWDYNRHVWVADVKNPSSPVGVELPFKIMVSYITEDDEKLSFIFFGTADGLLIDSTPSGETPVLIEHKTTSKVSEGWRDGFVTSTQITGYMLALSFLTGLTVESGEVHALSPKLPIREPLNGIVMQPVMRIPESEIIKHWFVWFLNTALLGVHQKEKPDDTLRNPNACIQYFRPCVLFNTCFAPPIKLVG